MARLAAAAALNHPNIVTVHSTEEAEGVRFITMEWVEGQTLGQLIPRGGVPLDRFFQLAVPLVDALSAAHQKGITHRDLKPENVMVSNEGRVKILDFGLAKLRETSVDGSGDSELRTASVTQDGRILGTVAYMSPEQAQGQAVDPRSDIFSVGILLYQMATGERPFRGKTNLSVLSSILKDKPASVSDLNQGLPRPLGRMIQRALEKNPEGRYQSALDLRKDLEDLKRDLETGEISASSPSLRLLPLHRGRGWALAGGALVLLLVALATAVLFVSPSRQPAAVPVAAADDARPSLAVFYFDNLTKDPSLDWLRTGLTNMLVTDLSQSPEIRVLGTARLYQILDDMGRLDEPTISFEAVQAVARQAHVTMAVVGSFVRSGSTIRITAQLQDTRSGEVVSAERVEGEGEASLFSLVDDLTGRIRSRLELPATADMELDRDLEDVTTTSVEAYRHYAEGIALHERLREEEAIPHLETAVELDPDFAMALAKLSVSHGNLGHFNEEAEFSRRALEHVDRLTPRERHYVEGRYYSLRPETTDKAIAAYSKAVELFPDHSSARHNLSLLLIPLRRHHEAIRHLEELRRRGTTFSASLAMLAGAYSAVGDWDKGLEVLEEYLQQNPDSSDGHRKLANYLLTGGRYDEAAEAFRTAEALEPGHREVAQGRWTASVLTGRWDEAEAVAAGLAASTSPIDRFTGLSAQYLLHLYGGRLQQAEALERRLAGQPAGLERLSAQAHIFAASLRFNLGRYEEALALASRAQELASEAPELLVAGRVLAVLSLASLGRSSEAESGLQALQELVKSLPQESVQVGQHVFLGRLALAREDYETAIGELSRARWLLPPGAGDIDDQRGWIWYGLASAHHAKDELDQALEWYQRLIDGRLTRLVLPLQYVRSLYRVAQIHDGRGQTEEAAQHYQRFLQHWEDGEIDRDRVADAQKRLDTLTAGSPDRP